MTTSEKTDEHTEAREALFWGYHAITELEIAAKRILTSDEACKITTKGAEVFLATRKEMGDNFKRAITLLHFGLESAAVKKRTENI